MLQVISLGLNSKYVEFRGLPASFFRSLVNPYTEGRARSKLGSLSLKVLTVTIIFIGWLFNSANL